MQETWGAAFTFTASFIKKVLFPKKTHIYIYICVCVCVYTHSVSIVYVYVIIYIYTQKYTHKCV